MKQDQHCLLTKYFFKTSPETVTLMKQLAAQLVSLAG